MSLKIKPNEPCPCQSGRKYKKCCRKKVIRDLKKTEPIRMFEHARICKGMYDNFLPMVSKHIVKQNKQPYSLIAYHPVHCIHFTADKKYKLSNLHEVGQKAILLDENSNETDFEGRHVSISGKQPVNYEYNGNCVRYHLGMYAVIYFNIREMADSEPISLAMDILPGMIDTFKQKNSAFMEDFEQYYQTMLRFEILVKQSKYMSDEQKRSFSKLAEELKNSS